MLKTAKVYFDDDKHRTYDYYFDDRIIKVTNKHLVLVEGGDRFTVGRVDEILYTVSDSCTKPVLASIHLSKAFQNRVDQERILVEEMLK